MMGNKKVQDKLIALGMVAGLGTSVAMNGKMLVDLDQLGAARRESSNCKKQAISQDTYQAMLKEADTAVWEAFEKGIISAEDFTRLMKENHSDNFAYENRYKLLDKATANAWEQSVENERKQQSQMCTSAVLTGSTLGGVGLLSIYQYSRKQKESEEEEENTL